MILFYLITSLLACYLVVEYIVFSRSRYTVTADDGFAWVHFIHGSYPKRACIDQRKRVGGLLGGHVEIEIDKLVYGFEYGDPDRIHIFPRKALASCNLKFTLKQQSEWLTETLNDKITSIRIPLEASKKQNLIRILQSHQQVPPYDYAFFGMRCASSTYEDLALAGILPKKSRLQYIVNAFYPRQLRQRMLRWAKFNQLTVQCKPGIACRVWE